MMVSRTVSALLMTKAPAIKAAMTRSTSKHDGPLRRRFGGVRLISMILLVPKSLIAASKIKTVDGRPFAGAFAEGIHYGVLHALGCKLRMAYNTVG